MNISIIGTGYVGLVTGTCFADVGNQVLCVDNDRDKVAGLREGKLPIFEPGLERLVKNGIAQQTLSFTTDIEKAVDHADIIFIAVGTPEDEDGSADMSHVLAVAKSIGESLKEPNVIVTKSTVPVGTALRVRETIQRALDERGVDISFSVASNPEFLKEGAAIEDFMKPDRVILGADDETTVSLMRTLYAPFNRNHERLIVMDITSAELTKYAANAMLATKISFMNELANIAELMNADIELVRQGIGSDPRIGYHFIYPGCGYGGSCFPKDVKALGKMANDHGYDAQILQAVEDVNQRQKSVLIDKTVKRFGEDLSGKEFAVWGLAFKPNTDDLREASSEVIINGLLERGATIRAYDPIANKEAAHLYADKAVTVVDDAYVVTDGADALLLVTEWKAFRSPDFEKLKQQLKSPVIIDGRNIYDPQLLQGLGIEYYGIGRTNSH